jgi:hypothetical protein
MKEGPEASNRNGEQKVLVSWRNVAISVCLFAYAVGVAGILTTDLSPAPTAAQQAQELIEQRQELIEQRIEDQVAAWQKAHSDYQQAKDNVGTTKSDVNAEFVDKSEIEEAQRKFDIARGILVKITFDTVEALDPYCKDNQASPYCSAVTNQPDDTLRTPTLSSIRVVADVLTKSSAKAARPIVVTQEALPQEANPK